MAILLAAALVVIPANTAGADPGDVNDYLARVNRLRASVGAQPLSLDSNLSSLAQSWAQTMASNGTISHTPNLAGGVTAQWSKLGENVGMGPNTELIFNGFVNSPLHYANLVDPAFTHIGIGVVWVNGTQFTTHRFMAVRSIPAPAPQPAPTPQPAQPPVYTPPAPTQRSSAPAATPVPAPDTPTAYEITPAAPTVEPLEPARVAAVLDALHSLGA